MRLLVVILSVLIFNSLCEARGKGNHHHRKHKSGHVKKHQYHGNHHNSVTGKLDIHRADGCNCPPDQMCVNGKSTEGPMCVTSDFIKEGKHLLKEFNLHESHGYKLKGNNKPHNLHISIHANKHSEPESRNHMKDMNRAKPNHHHKKGNKHGHKKLQKQITTCTPDNMSEMRQRLAGWFRLLHAQDRETHPHHKHHGHHKFKTHMSVKKELRNHHHGHCKCLKSVMWEMHHLDQDKDRQLNRTELQEIERNNMEPCLRPYLNSCDHNGDGRLSNNEWCCCFSEVLPPCYKELRNLQEKLLRNEKDLVLPKCDHEGFYAKEQCKGDHHNARTCWCVDLNGNKIPHTEAKVRAHCGQLNSLGLPKRHH